MTPLARVRVRTADGRQVAAIDGEIDASNADEISLALRQGVTNQAPGLIVDLSGTRYVDSAGINLLFTLADELRSRRLELALVVTESSPIARMIAITSLDRLCPTFPTVDAALGG